MSRHTDNGRIRAASDRLTAALLTLAARGQSPPCTADDRWLSEDQDERATAARLCAGCPVLEPCRMAAAAQGERFGVWAGVDRTRAPGKPGRPPSKPDNEAAA